MVGVLSIREGNPCSGAHEAIIWSSHSGVSGRDSPELTFQLHPIRARGPCVCPICGLSPVAVECDTLWLQNTHFPDVTRPSQMRRAGLCFSSCPLLVGHPGALNGAFSRPGMRGNIHVKIPYHRAVIKYIVTDASASRRGQLAMD